MLFSLKSFINIDKYIDNDSIDKDLDINGWQMNQIINTYIKKLIVITDKEIKEDTTDSYINNIKDLKFILDEEKFTEDELYIRKSENEITEKVIITKEQNIIPLTIEKDYKEQEYKEIDDKDEMKHIICSVDEEILFNSLFSTNSTFYFLVKYLKNILNQYNILILLY